jgi:hypothetical protein
VVFVSTVSQKGFISALGETVGRINQNGSTRKSLKDKRLK